jgi:hypothetical protein
VPWTISAFELSSWAPSILSVILVGKDRSFGNGVL